MWKPKLSDELLAAAAATYPGAAPTKRKDRAKSISVFANPFLEKWFVRAHWVTPGVCFFPLAAIGIYQGLKSNSGLAVLGLFASGYLIWTLIEYVLHRWIFHVLQATPEHPDRYLVHGYHHDFPDDQWRLVMVPIGSFPLAVIFGLLFRLAFGAQYWMPAFAGAMVGYVMYDWIHYYTHHGRPKGGLGKWLRMYHLQHHHSDEPSRFGVSSPIWDFVFGTYRPVKSAAKAPPSNSVSAA